MVYEKFIVITNSFGTSISVLEAIIDDPMTHYAEIIDEKAVCIDGVYSSDELHGIFNANLLLDVDIRKLSNRYRVELMELGQYILDGVSEFIEVTDISNELDYFLDLILERGGQHNLSYKELQRLDELNVNKRNFTE